MKLFVVLAYRTFLIAALMYTVGYLGWSATWLSDAHMLCTDQGVPQGNIADRIRALRDKLAQPSQAGELSDSERWDIVTNWFSDEDMQSRAMQMLGDIKQASAAINAKGDV